MLTSQLVRVLLFIVSLMQYCAPDRNWTGDLYPVGQAPLLGEWLCSNRAIGTSVRNHIRSKVNFYNQLFTHSVCKLFLLTLWYRLKRKYYVAAIFIEHWELLFIVNNSHLPSKEGCKRLQKKVETQHVMHLSCS